MPARIGAKYANDMFALIGSVTRRGRAEMALGMGGAMAATRRTNMIQYGKRATGFGIMGASGIGMAASNRSTGAYNPAPRPMTSAPPGIGRSA